MFNLVSFLSYYRRYLVNPCEFFATYLPIMDPLSIVASVTGLMMIGAQITSLLQ